MGVPVAEAQVEWPVESWLQLAQPAMDDPLLGILTGRSEVIKNGTSDLHKLGDLLYKALLQEAEAIRESWLRAQGIAQNRHELLRFRLGLKESRLQRLPWEVLHRNGHPLTTRFDLTFTRYAANLLVGQPFDTQNLPEVDTALRVLMVVAGPEDQSYLELLQEKVQLQALLAEDGAILPIDIQILEQPDRNALAQALEQGNYQVLHYAGHSDFSDSGGDLLLVNRQTGLTERLSGDDLAGLLVNNRIALTVFNSCRSGHTAKDDAEMDWRQQNLVQALVNRGVPSVIAMAEKIPDQVAIAFTQLFYKNIRKGYPIDLSLSRTRQGLISAFGSDEHYWALPILYLQPDFDGYLVQGDQTFADPNAVEALPMLPPNASASASVLEQQTRPTTDLEQDIASLVNDLTIAPEEAADPPDTAPENGTDNGVAADSSAQDDSSLSEAAQLPPDQLSTQTPTAAVTPGSDQQTHSAPGTVAQILTRRPLALGLVVGLIALVGVCGLIVALLRRSPAPPGVGINAPLPSQPSRAELGAASSLLTQAQQALDEERYGDARQDFERALTQELQGTTGPREVSDQIWPFVSESQNSDLLYIQGRIRWQEIARREGDAASFEQGQEERNLAAQALAAWEQTDDTFLKGRVARGFAHYSTGQLNRAIANWEAALTLYDQQRQAQPDPVNAPVTDPVILHAYAGLVMARTRAAELNLDALTDDDRIAEAPDTEQTLLQADADSELADAREYFQQLQALDPQEWVAPENLQAVNASPETWHNWLWTDALRENWGEVYRRFQTPVP